MIDLVFEAAAITVTCCLLALGVTFTAAVIYHTWETFK